MLNEEKSSDDTLRQQFKERWTRTPSEKLTEMFRSNSAKYRQLLNNAIEADKVIREKFDSHKQGMELLSNGSGAIENALPSGNCGNVENCSAVGTLRQLMEEASFIITNKTMFCKLGWKILK